jgi:hypothetical protein
MMRSNQIIVLKTKVYQGYYYTPYSIVLYSGLVLQGERLYYIPVRVAYIRRVS